LHSLGRGLGQIEEPAIFPEDEDEGLDGGRGDEDGDGKGKKYESPYKHLYKDDHGNLYDPNKKFGEIQDDSLLYERVTSSYPLNLPTDYYHKYI